MSEEEIESLRRAFTAPGGTAPRPADCPEPETIWAAVHGELPPGEVRDVVDHTALCPACAEDWRLAVEVRREEGSMSAMSAIPAMSAMEAGAPAMQRARPLWARRAPLLAAAAVILLLVVGLPLWQRQNAPVLRGDKPLVSLLEEGQELPRNRCLLRWSGPPGAIYEVDLHTLTGQSLDRSQGLTAPRYLVPEAKLAGLPAGTRLEWQVKAALPGRAPLYSRPAIVILR